MNGHPNETLLALYAGGEIDTRERPGVEAHLDTCGKCRNTISEIEHVRQLLSSTFTEPAHEDLQLVRDGVSSAVAGSTGRRSSWRWNTAATAVVGISIICALLLNRKQPGVALKQDTVQLPSVPLVSRQFSNLSWSATPKQHRARAREAPLQAGIRAASVVTAPDGTSQLKLTTADPNVVILLSLEGTDRHEN